MGATLPGCPGIPGWENLTKSFSGLPGWRGRRGDEVLQCRPRNQLFFLETGIGKTPTFCTARISPCCHLFLFYYYVALWSATQTCQSYGQEKQKTKQMPALRGKNLFLCRKMRIMRVRCAIHHTTYYNVLPKASLTKDVIMWMHKHTGSHTHTTVRRSSSGQECMTSRPCCHRRG